MCWYSNPIGNTETSFLDIKLNMYRLQKKNRELRSCRECKENLACVKCTFPYPLSHEKYCKYKRSNATIEAAKLIDNFNIVKDFLFKPLNPFEL